MKLAYSLSVTLAFATVAPLGWAAPEVERAKEILEVSGIEGGFVVHLGCGDGKLTAALKTGAGKAWQVHGIDREISNVEAARKALVATGEYGEVSADRLVGDTLPYADSLVNLLVCEDAELLGIDKNEVMRALAPLGAACVWKDGKWEVTSKPWPKELDEWTHYLYNASGNPVAKDEAVGPPRHLQWLGTPRWSRHHDRMASMSALVSAGGRIFYIMDEGSRVSIQLPAKWTLVARDAFNGTVLWKRPIPKWHNHLWPLKSGPTQLARRLVATKDYVFVTLGIDAPVEVLDPATGETLRTIEDSNGTEEVIFTDGVMYLLVNHGESELANYEPKHNVGDQKRVATEFKWNEKPREVFAVAPDTGEVMWRKETKVAPLSMAANAENVMFHDGEKVVCLGRPSGNVVWTTEPVKRRGFIPFNFGTRVLVHNDVVLYAGGDRTMKAFSAETGKELWEAPHPRSGYQSMEDLMVAGGLVWGAPTTSGKDSGVFTGRDPVTGEVQREFAPDADTYWFHHRCYISKATEKFIMTSRTGVEFIDPEKQSWGINHWVRGGCHYGIMPCNGLVYTPPHNCACYPEAKLYGINALAAEAPTRPLPREVPEFERLEKGPAYDAEIAGVPAADDWPTYRGSNKRSGFTTATVKPAGLQTRWKAKPGGRLSAVTVAEGKLFVAKVDEHEVLALDSKSGEPAWGFRAGGRVDSPPTAVDGRVLFGSMDGYVYCLRASDGALVWKFRAAPVDRRLMAFEQLESVWPVHGNILVQEGVAYFVAGRSNFLDGGMRYIRLEAKTGKLLGEKILDQQNTDSDENLQVRIQTLQMPVGLPDILSSDGKFVYMRSQRFEPEGKRLEVGPVSGNAAVHGGTHTGEGAHLFSPTGFVDGSWFHRSYWVYGKNFAGGHNGYYQAGKYAPSGRILVHDEEKVYGFGRKPQYLRWTTPLEHQLFSAKKEPATPPVASAPKKRGKGGGGASMVSFPISKSLDPTGKPLTVQAWVKTEKPVGVVVARGGPADGYAIHFKGGKPHFAVRGGNELSEIAGEKGLVNKWAQLVGVLHADKKMELYVNGELAATGTAKTLIATDPKQGLEFGADDGSAVSDAYASPSGLKGTIDEVRIFHRALSSEEVRGLMENPADASGGDEALVLACTFDKGKARDSSGRNNHGVVASAEVTKGIAGNGMRFIGTAGKKGGKVAQKGSGVAHHWTQEIPLLVRAMAGAGNTLFIAGPPDIVDEEASFAKIMERDTEVRDVLARQAALLQGADGALLWAVNKTDGTKLAEYKLDSLPVWDSLAVAGGRLYFTTENGDIVCMGE